MKTYALRIGMACALAVLTACGSDTQTSTLNDSTARGTLVENPPFRIASVNAAALAAQLGASAAGQQLLQVAGAPLCGVDFNYMHYWTVGGKGEAESASGALMVPTGAAPACSGPRPIVLYAHATQFDKNANIADITDPNNTEGALIAAMFAARGYIVVAPNYVGYDSSSSSYHPFLNEDAQTKDMIDALTAARSALGKVLAATTTDNGKLFITGYSQGGYVAMATHKAMQAAGLAVTASAPMSGPYALAALFDAVFFGHVNLGATEFAPILTLSYQKAYGNVYTAPSDTYAAAYAPTIEGLLPSATPIAQLISAGKLPQLQLFHNTVWATGTPLDALLDEPPATSAVNALYDLGFGPANLINDSYRLAYVQDAAANPDGVLLPLLNPGAPPTPPVPAAAPANPLRQDLKLNDLRNWTPQAPVLMCGGMNDPTIYFSVNALVMQEYWTVVAPPVSPALVTVLDLESQPSGAADPFAAAKLGFQATVAAVAAAAGGGAAGQSAVAQVYHGTLVPPFCAAAARGFFSQF